MFKEMDFTVSPSSVRIFYKFEDTEPLLVKVENHSNQSQKFKVEIDLPEDVEAKYKGVKTGDTLTESFNVASGRQEKMNIYLQYNGTDRRRDIIDVSLVHEKGRKDKEVDTLLIY